MINSFPKILFFILSSKPTAKELVEAAKLGPNVCFRNAAMVSETEAFEPCDGIAGAVPKRYAEAKDEKTGKPRFLFAEEALAQFGRKMAEAVEIAEEKSKAVGGKAPEPNQTGEKPVWKPNA